MAELANRQRDADKAIRDQVTKIEDQKVSRERQFERQVHRVTREAASNQDKLVDKDLLQRQRKISELREKYNLQGEENKVDVLYNHGDASGKPPREQTPKAIHNLKLAFESDSHQNDFEQMKTERGPSSRT